MNEPRLPMLLREFEARYRRPAELGARAPGRVDLMGSHTDYNEGWVLTLPIDRDTWIVAAASADDRIRIASCNTGHAAEFPASDPLRDRTAKWDLYVRGVVHVMRGAGYEVGGFDALVHGTVPLSSGLSSSASLECATAVLVSALSDRAIESVELARLCQQAENEVVGVSCGILDQYTSMLGEEDCALLLDCRHLTHEHVRIPADLQVVICDTRAPRRLAGSEYGERRAQCEQGAEILVGCFPGARTLRDIKLEQFEAEQARLPKLARKRSRFIVEENERVGDLGRALGSGDRPAIDRIAAASFAGARDLFEISVPEMEAMFAAMRAAPGAVGARQAGGGFGGCMVAFVDAGVVGPFRESVATAYQKSNGIVPELYAVRPAAGGGLLEVAA
jgi:galactokinase